MSMMELVADFPAQLREAIAIGKAATIRPHEHPIHKIYVAGLGGSGIGANFVAAFVRDECPVPYLIGKGYSTPKYIDQNTLVICSSYSGNTEETVQAFEQMRSTGAKIVCVTSAGKLLAAAKENDLDYVALPSGKPAPRACLGYSLVQQLFILQKLGLIGNDKLAEIATAAELLKKEQANIKVKAQKVAAALNGKIPVIYCEDSIEPVAVRFRQQINENSKMLCWHHVIPEMNHNELVGWKKENKATSVIILRNETDLKRNQIRTDICKDIISKLAGDVNEVWSKGNSLIERSMYLVHLVDWVSVLIAAANNTDAMEIDVIDYLKGELAKY